MSASRIAVASAVASAVALLALAALRRRHRRRREPEDSVTIDAAAFQQHALSTSADPAQCVLRAATAFAVNNFWQGSFSLTETDLRATLGPRHAAESTAALVAAGVPDAYRLRKELVNFKKACLRTYHDACKVLETLQRQDQYFFRDTSSGHVRGLCALPLRDDAPVDLETHRAEYASVCHCFQRAKGFVMAINDARDFTKFLCSLPRHPDDAERIGGEGVHRRLKQMPDTFSGFEALVHAESFLAASRFGDELEPAVRRRRANGEGGDNVSDDRLPPHVLRAGLAAVMEAHKRSLPHWPPHVHEFVRLSLVARGGAKALSIRDACQHYYDALVEYQERMSRALDALAVDESRTQRRALQLGVATWAGATELTMRIRRKGDDPPPSAPQRVTGIVDRAASPPGTGRADLLDKNGHDGEEGARRGTKEAVDEHDDERVWLVRRRLGAGKHIHKLSGIRETNGHLLNIVRLLLARHTAQPAEASPSRAHARAASSRSADAGTAASTASTQRLFVAGDALERAMFYPPEFEAVRSVLAELANAARHFGTLQAQAMALEGWPPPAAAMRTRVQVEGDLRCIHCEGRFSKQWVARGVCWQCEAAVRACGRCPFDTRQCGLGTAAVGRARSGNANGKPSLHYGSTCCVHQGGLCVVCDGGFAPCAECRLAQGDGETVASVVANWRGAERTVLFFDFDRSLCSTKAGGSPLQGAHSLDADLADLASQHTMYVVTRNSHRAEIEQFLAARGVPCMGVAVVKKGHSKASKIVELLPCLADEPPSTPGALPPCRAVFVDDGVRECCDERVAALPGLYRVLFRRGAVI